MDSAGLRPFDFAESVRRHIGRDGCHTSRCDLVVNPVAVAARV
jgi:hypothetical protein